MKIYAIKKDNRYLPIPDKESARKYGEEHPLAYKMSHTNKGVVSKHLKKMQANGVWLGAIVVEL